MKYVLHQLSILIALLVLPLFFFWRVVLVDSVIGAGFGLDGVFDAAVINADAPLLALMGLLILGSWYIKSYVVGIGLRVIALVLLLLYITDLIVFQQFGIRILLSSVQIYATETATIWEQLQAFLGGQLIAIVKLVLLGIFSLTLLCAPKKPWTITILFCAALTLSATVAALMPWKINYVNSWVIQNYLSANMFAAEAKTYSEAYVADVLNQPSRELRCEAGLQQQKNVIILIVESLSAYQSKVFGGIKDWTPELDAIASEAVVFTNMHANGFATNEGLIGILGGVRLFSPFTHMFQAVVPFQTAWGLENTVPREFNEVGYHTAFLTTGPLGFSKKGVWLRDIGFQEIEGNEHPFYKHWPKVQFHGPADEALYARSLDWISERALEQPWMLTLLTITTHQPYLDPETLNSDQEQAFRYADREAAAFIRSLQKLNYFEKGLLFVLGDHRSMTPVSKEEEGVFGSAALSRVQFLMFGQGTPGEHNGVFQQSDLLPSFRQWLSDEYCYEGQPTSVFTPDSKGRCALHVRGSQHSLVDVFCPEGIGLVRLDGDSTQFIENEGIMGEQQSEVLQAIARERLKGDQRHLRWQQTHK